MATVLVELPVVRGNGQGTVFTMQCSAKTTFKDVSNFLAPRLGDCKFRFFLGERGSRTLEEIACATLSRYMCLTHPIPLSARPKGGPHIDIYIRTLTGKTVNCSLEQEDTVGDLKRLVQRQEGIPPDQQRFIFGGKQLSEEERLCDDGIKDESTLHLVLRLRGGGGPPPPFSFVDVSNDTARRDIQWSDSAPQWRVAMFGLVVEGICENAACVAFLEVVLCNRGMGAWDLGKIDARCPMCETQVQADNMAFNNCFYKIRGVKSETFDEFATPWTKVGDCYRTWDEDEAGVVEWNNLEVVARSLDRGLSVRSGECEVPVAESCAICFETIVNVSLIKMLGCCHSYHEKCWTEWEAAVRGNAQTITCPICRAVVGEPVESAVEREAAKS